MAPDLQHEEPDAAGVLLAVTVLTLRMQAKLLQIPIRSQKTLMLNSCNDHIPYLYLSYHPQKCLLRERHKCSRRLLKLHRNWSQAPEWQMALDVFFTLRS